MTPEQNSSGEAIEDVGESRGSILPVPTSISVFIGSVTENETVDNSPIRLSSYDSYISKFGTQYTQSGLSQALDMFFLNGGRDCYIIDIGKLPDTTDNWDEQLTNQYRQAMKSLDSVDKFNLLILTRPEQIADSVYLEILAEAAKYCQQNKAFLLIDPLKEWRTYEDILNDIDGITKLRNTVDPASSALYFPRLYRENNRNARRISSETLDPTPAIAGLISRFDNQRGIWKAPAGIEAHIHGVTDVDIQLTEAQIGSLNQMGINCIRMIDKKVVCWGARTLAGFQESVWKYIPVRRLAMYIVESLLQATQWAAFGPNEEITWALIKTTVSQFMFKLFRNGAFQGTDPTDAFFVKCDNETTTPVDQKNGIMNIEVGFAPSKPAEFIIIKIQQSMN